MNKHVIEQMIMSARKENRRTELNVYCLVKAEFLRAEKEKGIEPNEEKCFKIIYKMMDQRRDSMSQYINAGRKELADNEAVELGVLATLVPKMPSEDEILDTVTKVVESYKNTNGSVSMKDTKNIIMLCNEKMSNVPNIGKVVSTVIKQYA